MMKRIVSLLLCLIMVCGIAAPTVQAEAADDIFVTDELSNVIIGDNVQLENVTVDGNSVGVPAQPSQPPLGTMQTPTASVMEQMNSAEADSACPCDQCETIAEHRSDCLVKAEYHKLCAGTAEELFAVWGDYTAEEQDYILQYLEENYSYRYGEFMKLLNAPTGEASETFADGTTVSVQGIPEDSTLTVQEAADEVKELVNAYVAENAEQGTELFSCDVSVQDGEGADWQPEATVKMELEVPGTKLHKYAKVYVVHVDDNGEASTIEAEVTEDGKIAFETPGFSTFAGFTVDFEYNGEGFSINGMTDILVSEMMDRLKMPLYIEDVADVAFTDESLVSVTAQEGDWLLTSLKAYDTDEQLTLTMKDGTQYVIKVTDAQFATTAEIYVGGTQADTDGNGECTWYLSGYSGEVGYAYFGHNWETAYGGSYADGWSSSSVIEIEGPGTFQITLQHQQRSDYYDRAYWGGDTCALQVNIRQIKITNGAKLVFRLGSYFSGKESSITICGTADVPIFDIQDGSLFFCVSGNNETALPAGAYESYFGTGYSKGHIPVYLDGQDQASGATSPLIYAHRGTDGGTTEPERIKLVAEDVTFKNAKHRAVLVQTNNMHTLSFTNCTFSSTVRDVKYGGGAIYIDGETDTSDKNVVDVKNFLLTNCTFSGNTGAGGPGGAIASYGDIYKLYVKNCSFQNCTSASRGGAIELSVNEKTAGNYIYDWIKFENTRFTNCTAGSHGGAIDISNGDKQLYLASSLTISGCTFTNCKATGNRGGAIRMVVSAASRDITIENSGFTGCTSGTPGGAFSVQGSIGNISVSGYKSDSNGNFTFRNCSNGADFGGALLVDCSAGNVTVYNAVFTGNTSKYRGGGVALLCPKIGNIAIESSVFSNNTAGSIGGGFYVGIRDSEAGSLTAGAVTIHGSVFSGNKANSGVGGCLAFTDGTYDSFLVQGCDFSDSYSANFGGAIAIKTCAEDQEYIKKYPTKIKGNLTVEDCTFSNCVAGGLAPELYDHDGNPDTPGTETWDHDEDPSTPEIMCLNGTGGGGAIALGAEVMGADGVIIRSSGTSYADKDAYETSFTNCYTWNGGGAVYCASSLKTRRLDMKYVRITGCRARDAGNAIYLAGCIIDDFWAYSCTMENCSYFTQDFDIDIPGTAYDSLGKNTYIGTDYSGTFRCVGDTTCRAKLEMCTLTGNKSRANGGAVYWNGNNNRIGAGGTLVKPALVLYNSRLDGNHAERDGGALYVEATVQVMNCIFSNNTANYRGGAIAQQIYNNTTRKLGADESNNLALNVYTSVFGNRAALHGGGISITVAKTTSVEDGTNLIYPVKFRLGGAKVYENKAGGNGGGIYYSTATYDDPLEQREVDNYQKEILIDNGLIFSNIAGYDDPNDNVAATGGSGGGIYMSSSQKYTGDDTGYSKVTISGGNICDNHAMVGDGGGVYLRGTNALCVMTGGIIGSDVDNIARPNSATSGTVNGVSTGGNGGGIAVFDGARMEMSGGSIVNNISERAGGGIAVHAGSVASGSTMYLSEGYVENNSSHIGGGISLHGAKGDSTSADEAKKYGMYFNGGHVFNNHVTPGADGYALGGGICISNGSTMKINKGEIENNTAASDSAATAFAANQEGGGIAVCQQSVMDINGGRIAGNKAYDGGGLCIRGDSTVNMQGSMTVNDKDEVTQSDGVIADNIAYNYGGGAYLGAYITSRVNRFYLNDGWIYSNEAKNCGGGVFVGSYNGFYLNGGRIDENISTATGEKIGGGGVYSYYAVVQITNGVMKGNVAYAEGGALFDDHGSTTITGGTLTQNNAKGCGGALYARRSKEIRISNGLFESNYAKYGGGMYLYGAETYLSGGCVFTKNNANQGGGLFIRSGNTTIDGGTISYNECILDPAHYAGDSYRCGGGILVDNNLGTESSTSVVTINGGSIHHNKAPEGGGLWMRNSGTQVYHAPKVEIYGGIISHNTVEQSGGGIFIHGGTKDGTTLNMYGGEISDNTCDQRGGGINADNWAKVLVSKYTNPTTGEVTRPVITRNTGGRGGGIFVCYGAELTVDEGFITFNHAKGNSAETTAYNKLDQLYGIGGGIGVGSGYSASKPAKFTLQGENMAIYGNIADFGADDVFSNGKETLLNIPEVLDMNMAAYKFMPEAWFEDYPKNDTSYKLGTVRNKNYDAVTRNQVYRYRGSVSINRFMIDDDDLDTLVNVPDKYICITLGIPSAVDDTVVCDYGLNVSVDVIANDNILSASEINKPGILSIHAPVISDETNEDQSAVYEHDGIIYGGLDSTFQSGDLSKQQNKLAHGKASLLANSANILYQMDASSLSMTKEDSFYYAVWHKGPKGNAYYYYAKVTVVPATSIYYEDNCGGITYIDAADHTLTYGYWKDVKSVVGSSRPSGNSATVLSGIYQNEDRPGSALIPEVDMDNLYGYDGTYAESETFSMGSAKWVRVNEHYDASARFTFTGTGYDIISLCSNKTGMIMVDLYEGNQVPADTFDSPNYIDTVVVDTFYGCTLKCYKYTYTYISGVWSGVKEEISQDELGKSDPKPKEPKNGDVVVQYLCEITPSNDSTNVAYQVPILKRQGLEYGTYTAEIYIAYSPWMEDDRHPTHYCDFYLDAIRVYDPANNGATSETVKNTYLQDGEGWPVYQELRNMFITQEELTNKPTTGIVFMDGTDYSVGSYKNYGANNEVYLAKNQTIGFKLDELRYMEEMKKFSTSDFDTSEESIVANIHLGIKSLNGTGALTITGTNLTTNKTVSLNFTPGNTEMFYDITDLKNSIVTIKNTGNSIISLTNVKITHTEEPVSSSSNYARNIVTVNDEIAQQAIALVSGDVDETSTVPTLTPKYPTLSFEGEIKYNIYFETKGLEGLNPERFGLALFSTEDQEGTLATADAAVSGAVDSNGLMVVSTEGIPAKKLGDTLYFKVYALLEDGSVVYSSLFNYSALKYAKSILASSAAAEKQKALVVAMLNYGAAAQTYFGYNTDHLMNSGLTDEQQALVSGFYGEGLNGVSRADAAKCGSFVNNGGFTKVYPTVSFDGAFQVQYYFTPAHMTTGDITFCYWSQETYESCETLTVENADIVELMPPVNGECKGVSPELAAKELDQVLYVAAFYEYEGERYSTDVLTYSLARYCESHATNAASAMRAFASAAAVYGSAAKKYFEQ